MPNLSNFDCGLNINLWGCVLHLDLPQHARWASICHHASVRKRVRKPWRGRCGSTKVVWYDGARPDVERSWSCRSQQGRSDDE
eukprot:3139217-Rhodomonas_salina.3